jgi:Mrp family chromosome partitioning ATPase/LPS O-antigen subunit length determinant protein (WzzB/FepE family)
VTPERRSAIARDQQWQDPATDGEWADRPGVLASLSRYRLIVVVVTLLVAALAYVVSSQLPVEYKAEATLILRDPGAPGVLSGSSGSTQDVDRQAAVAKQADIMTSTIVLDRAARLLGGATSTQQVRSALDVRPSKNLTGITIDAKAGDAASARAMANAVGTAYQQVSNERTTRDAQQAIAGIDKLVARLQAEINSTPQGVGGSQTSRQQALSSQIADLKQREQDITTQLAVNPSGVELFEQAQLPDAPTQPKPELFALLGAVLGAIGAGGWAWWAAARNQRAEQREDPARILGAPLLGEVPRFRARQPLAGEPLPSSPAAADAYHFILASLEHELGSIGGTSVVLLGVTPGDGTTTTALNVAIAARQEDRKVALIDADQRSRRLSELCGLSPPDEGRSEPVEGPVDTDEYLARLAVTHSGIVLPVPANEEPGRMSRLFRPPAFRKALLSIGEQFDLVLIDTPALLAVPDAIPIARQADGVVLVVDRDVPLSHLRTVRDRLSFVSTPVIGYVFVQKRGRRSGGRASWRPSLPRRPRKSGEERQLAEPAAKG